MYELAAIANTTESKDYITDLIATQSGRQMETKIDRGRAW